MTVVITMKSDIKNKILEFSGKKFSCKEELYRFLQENGIKISGRTLAYYIKELIAEEKIITYQNMSDIRKKIVEIC